MIALLRGTLVEKHPNQAILDVGGVGYDVIVPISTFSKLPEAGAEDHACASIRTSARISWRSMGSLRRTRKTCSRS